MAQWAIIIFFFFVEENVLKDLVFQNSSFCLKNF